MLLLDLQQRAPRPKDPCASSVQFTQYADAGHVHAHTNTHTHTLTPNHLSVRLLLYMCSETVRTARVS